MTTGDDGRIFVMDPQVMPLLDQFVRDVLALARRDEYQPLPHVVITGLLEVAGRLMKPGVALEPSALPTLFAQLDRVRDYITPATPEGKPLTRH